MAGLIPQTFIDDLIDRTDIVEVINSRVTLKKTGKNYSACCPFHNEKTPSFSVNPQKQFYYCFGCGAAGNAIGFVMEHDNLDFRRAVETLAHQAGMEIPQESAKPDPQHKKRQDIYSQLENAEKRYRKELKGSQTAINYLKSRGLSGTIARDFALGFAPDQWDFLTQPASADPATTKLLEDGGMLIRREQKEGFYDRFRNRIMFPIRDQRGRTIAFGGRVLGDEKPKYLNSPETPVFHKGRELYGLYEMLQQRAKPNFAIVVEGYMDVVALAQFGIHNAVATLGTSISQAHLEKLFRHVSQVIFCFDGDNAGRKAAERALDACLPTMLDGRQASFLFLPEGEDPDTIVQKFGKDKFIEQTNSATPLSDFLFQQASEGLSLNSDDQKLVVAHRMQPSIQKMPQGMLQRRVTQRLADFTGLPSDQLFTSAPAEVAAEVDTRLQSATTEPEPDSEESIDQQAEPDMGLRAPSPFLKRLLSLVLQQPQLAQNSKLEHPGLLDSYGTELFAQIREVLKEYPDAEFNTLLSYWMGYAPETAAELSKIYASTLLSDTSKEALEREFEEVIAHWSSQSKKDKYRTRLSELQAIPYEQLTEEQRVETRELFNALK